jgi:hypothetical protein
VHYYQLYEGIADGVIGSNSRFVGTLLMQNETAEAEDRFLKGITAQQSPAAMTTTTRTKVAPTVVMTLAMMMMTMKEVMATQ